jgi:hypothetical protein
MFNLIANTMFEATRVSAPETTQPRNRWFAGRTDALTPRSDLPEATRPAAGPPGEGLYRARNGTGSSGRAPVACGRRTSEALCSGAGRP